MLEFISAVRERVNIAAIPDISTGQLGPVGNIAVFLAADQRPQGLCPLVGGLRNQGLYQNGCLLSG